MSDYQLIQRLDDPNEKDENGNPVKRQFKVSFHPTTPLKLKPEAEERLRKQQEEKAAAQAAQTTTPEKNE
ncbi:hypothetical protein TRVA0_032S00298 [Trichomonascus vanleenenianus]|uniref:uncharacterized protein n=1 Tax=Trichomonascus vanleenenianus TaxID=2268995 RepID=UPI003ECB1240